MLQLGIIGAGRLGSFHADKAAQHPNVELVGVYDPLTAASETVAAKYGAKAFDDPDALLDAVDAVVIATPTVTHHAMGMRALKKERHVLMEKPLAVSFVEAWALVDAADKSGCILQVGHVERFNPAWKSALPFLEKALDDDKRVLIEAERSSPYTFRSTDIGTVLDMMIHDLDLVLSVVDSPVEDVEAVGFWQIDPGGRQGGHEDTVRARLRFENGFVATFFTSRVVREAVRCMTITTDAGVATIDFGSRKTTIITPDEAVLRGDFAPKSIDAAQAAALASKFMQEHFRVQENEGAAVDALALEMDDFVSAIENSRAPLVTGAQALRAVETAERILNALG